MGQSVVYMSLCTVTETSEVGLVERASLRAWPAEETAPLDGWLLRATRGFTRRANSVSPLACDGALPRGARIELAERWYRARNLRPCFQIGPSAAPSRLESDLIAAGYRAEGRTLVQAATVQQLLAHHREAPPPGLSVHTSETPTAEWLDVAVDASRFASQRKLFLSVLERLGSRPRYMTATVDGVPAAACLGVVDGGLLGIYDVFCLPAFRRAGVSTALMRSLAEYAAFERIRRVYLQAEVDNASARALYARLGFVTLYEYYYLTATRP
jgi:ribosomal protein S18 acetylase RimI-like enzyme